MVAFAVNPLTASGILTLVLQAQLQQFRKTGLTYFESFGTLRFVDGEAVFTPSLALQENLRRMREAREAEQFCLDAIELRLHEIPVTEDDHHART